MAGAYQALHNAILAVQSQIGTLQKNAINPHFKSKYISLEHLVEAVQPLLSAEGLIWVCRPSSDNEGRPSLVYSLTHAESSDSVNGEMPLLLEKQNAQGLGSAITYARRYALCAVLNIVADVDDDGEKAAKQKPAAKKPATLADQLRGKKKGAEIKAYVAHEFGATLDNVGVTADDLIVYLNGLNEEQKEMLLAWANDNG